MGSSSRRRPKCAWTAVRRSSGRPRSITVRVVRKGSMRTGPASKPSPRRMRPKCNQFRVRTAPGSGIDGSGEERSEERRVGKESREGGGAGRREKRGGGERRRGG